MHNQGDIMSYLDTLQAINNLLYSIFNDAKFVIDIQVYINTKRFELNEFDKNEIILDAMDGKFAQ